MNDHIIPTCAIDGCENEVPGFDDGMQTRQRGVVCLDCVAYQRRHAHWPDESRESCVECSLDDGAVRHDCEETFADSVIVTPGESCPCCDEVVEA